MGSIRSQAGCDVVRHCHDLLQLVQRPFALVHEQIDPRQLVRDDRSSDLAELKLLNDSAAGIPDLAATAASAGSGWSTSRLAFSLLSPLGHALRW